jgi:xanthine dehydrogenase YagT iron-sulfur-binding subunit
MTELDISRRGFLRGSAAAAGGVAAQSAITRSAVPAEAGPVRTPDMVDIVLEVNGRRRALTVEPRVTLLDALREQLGLTGTKRAATEALAAPAPCMSTAAG